jgi:hypothetical protein
VYSAVAFSNAIAAMTEPDGSIRKIEQFIESYKRNVRIESAWGIQPSPEGDQVVVRMKIRPDFAEGYMPERVVVSFWPSWRFAVDRIQDKDKRKRVEQEIEQKKIPQYSDPDVSKQQDFMINHDFEAELITASKGLLVVPVESRLVNRLRDKFSAPASVIGSLNVTGVDLEVTWSVKGVQRSEPFQFRSPSVTSR